ncbi:MAG: pantetheine-phosphate adenylyltransferase [Silvanigrellales bacterium]|nr:pantetheine-phosphate adenylyltransferase [Silvanigrellales bacterium]
MMTAAGKAAIYAGSFDPWSFGHQYVLDAGLEVFDAVHVLAAVNPAKQGTLSPETRARLIAHSIDPFKDWSRREPPFHVGRNVIVSATAGLVVDYAREQGITHLLRGLRSTSDFESEFNLYFSNRAIVPSIQTWAIMCPPDLLHCSSTYVRTVVGKSGVAFVGTSFLAQCAMLRKPAFVGEVFDLVQACSRARFENEPADLEPGDLNAGLQAFFTRFMSAGVLLNPLNDSLSRESLRAFVRGREGALRELLAEKKYPSEDVAELWALLVKALCRNSADARENWDVLGAVEALAGNLGRTLIPLLPRKAIEAKL